MGLITSEETKKRRLTKIKNIFSQFIWEWEEERNNKLLVSHNRQDESIKALIKLLMDV